MQTGWPSIYSINYILNPLDKLKVSTMSGSELIDTKERTASSEEGEAFTGGGSVKNLLVIFQSICLQGLRIDFIAATKRMPQ